MDRSSEKWCTPMFNQPVQQSREYRVYYWENTPTEQRVEAVFLYHLMPSYRQVGEWFDHSHQAVY